MPQRNPRAPGQPGPPLSRLTLGTSWDADRVRDLDRVSALEHVLDLDPGAGPITVVDTSNEYTQGLSEQIIGDALRRRGGTPAAITIATKLDRDPETGSFSAKRMRRSLEESRERLWLDVIPLLYLHDRPAPGRRRARDRACSAGPAGPACPGTSSWNDLGPGRRARTSLLTASSRSATRRIHRVSTVTVPCRPTGPVQTSRGLYLRDGTGHGSRGHAVVGAGRVRSYEDRRLIRRSPAHHGRRRRPRTCHLTTPPCSAQPTGVIKP